MAYVQEGESPVAVVTDSGIHAQGLLNVPILVASVLGMESLVLIVFTVFLRKIAGRCNVGDFTGASPKA